MKAFTYLLPALAAIASAGKVDECAGSCISKAIIATGCSSSDSLCICSSNSFINSVEECGPCSEDGANPAVALAQNYCESVSLSKRSNYEFGGHSYSWWQKEWRKVRAGHKSSEGGHGGEPSSYDPKPAPYHPEPKPAPYHPEPAPEPKPYQPKEEHPIEDWFDAHPNYLINHPGWLKNHPNWAAKHADYLHAHGYGSGGSPPSYPGGNPPHGYPHPQPPPNPHPTYPGKPTSTKTCTTNKPSPTVW